MENILTHWDAPGFSEDPSCHLSILKLPIITDFLPLLPYSFGIALSQSRTPQPENKGFFLSD